MWDRSSDNKCFVKKLRSVNNEREAVTQVDEHLTENRMGRREVWNVGPPRYDLQAGGVCSWAVTSQSAGRN